MELLDLFKPLSEIPEMDTSYFKPWTLDKLYQVEPELVAIAAKTVWKRPPPALRTLRGGRAEQVLTAPFPPPS